MKGKGELKFFNISVIHSLENQSGRSSGSSGSSENNENNWNGIGSSESNGSNVIGQCKLTYYFKILEQSAPSPTQLSEYFGLGTKAVPFLTHQQIFFEIACRIQQVLAAMAAAST